MTISVWHQNPHCRYVGFRDQLIPYWLGIWLWGSCLGDIVPELL